MSARSSVSREGAGAPLVQRLFLEAASRLACGELEVEFPDGSRHRFQGAEPGPAAVLRVHDVRALARTLTRGDTGFAEAYMDAHVDTPDLDALLELGALNEYRLSEALRERLWFRLTQRVAHLLRGNSRRGSRRNISFHYDLGNDFYRLWLDQGMTYSSALFESPEQSLESAQEAKYRRLLQRLDPPRGSHLLEIGCGWGGLAELAAREWGCRVTGLTLSREQYDHAVARIARAGLADRVEIRMQDYRDVAERFDHVVSVEMFEAVGERWWNAWFSSVSRCLEPGGRAAVQVITIDEATFPGYRAGTDFIQRYIFPGGMLPTSSLFSDHAAAAGLRTEEQAFFGIHYAQTLERWHRRVLEARDGIGSLGFDDRFLRMWRYYLSYCRAGFVTGRVNLMQTVLSS